jgi:hypothetical protein
VGKVDMITWGTFKSIMECAVEQVLNTVDTIVIFTITIITVTIPSPTSPQVLKQDMRMAASHSNASLFISIKNFFAKLFVKIDRDGSGSITLPEFQAILQDIQSSGGIANALMGEGKEHLTHHTRCTSYVTRHTSHVTRHTSHVTRHTRRSRFKPLATS